ncbi:MAG: hypothetical protein HY077_03255 [Elusimicrobia bacterium]|nr:hypothetical protein [Elusimicrobiota bacterium]
MALVLGLAKPSLGLFGSNHKITILWIPAESFDKWNELDEILENYKDLRFTIAVAPEDVPADAAKKLSAWSAAGRLELALRLPGIPSCRSSPRTPPLPARRTSSTG